MSKFDITFAKYGAILIFGLLVGFMVSIVTNPIQCEYNDKKLTKCINYSNSLLEVIASKEYCHNSELLANLNISYSFNFTG